jgi:hypothetical protein
LLGGIAATAAAGDDGPWDVVIATDAGVETADGDDKGVEVRTMQGMMAETNAASVSDESERPRGMTTETTAGPTTSMAREAVRVAKTVAGSETPLALSERTLDSIWLSPSPRKAKSVDSRGTK